MPVNKLKKQRGLEGQNDSVNGSSYRKEHTLSLDIDIRSTTNLNKSDTKPKKTSLPKTSSGRGKQIGVTVWKFLLSEFNLDSNTGIKDSTIEEKMEHGNEDIELLLNYIKLPIHLENFMLFGLLYSTVVLLKFLIIIPLRFLVHSIIITLQLFRGNSKPPKKHDTAVYRNDFILVSGILITLVLLKKLDTSRIYHNIRSGTAIKLYFMTQVLEIADRLLSASGQDIFNVIYRFDCLYINKKFNFVNYAHFVFLYILSILYLWFHSYILVYQVMALNVAINSYSNALLTLILSNQFSELKSAVFKKTEREGLFQVSCSDLNERFLILIMLGIISSRNLLQICINTASMDAFFKNLKPNSWSTQFTPWKTVDDWLGLLIGPSILVIGSEILVDWFKHGYIIRFNRIRPKVYDKFTKVLANDFVNGFASNQFGKASNLFNDHPNPLTKRTGFPISTVIIVFVKLTLFPYLQYLRTSSVNNETIASTICSWALILLIVILLASFIVFIRLLLSLILLRWSKSFIQKTKTQKIIDFVVGDPNVNSSLVSDVRNLLYDGDEQVPLSLEEIRLQKLQKNKDEKLNNVVRFEMVDKRIW